MPTLRLSLSHNRELGNSIAPFFTGPVKRASATRALVVLVVLVLKKVVVTRTSAGDEGLFSLPLGAIRGGRSDDVFIVRAFLYRSYGVFFFASGYALRGLADWLPSSLVFSRVCGVPCAELLGLPRGGLCAFPCCAGAYSSARRPPGSS